ncbi:hypothetical protein D3C84_687960 [compost metagenome]
MPSFAALDFNWSARSEVLVIPVKLTVAPATVRSKAAGKAAVAVTLNEASVLAVALRPPTAPFNWAATDLAESFAAIVRAALV